MRLVFFARPLLTFNEITDNFCALLKQTRFDYSRKNCLSVINQIGGQFGRDVNIKFARQLLGRGMM